MSETAKDNKTNNGSHSQQFAVKYSYPVIFTRDVFNPENQSLSSLMARSDEDVRVITFLDDGLVGAWPDLPDRIKRYFEVHGFSFSGDIEILPGGEKIKDGMKYVSEVISQITAQRLCRHSFVLAAGGGAFLDAVGLGAALVHRGMRLIRLPSTTLSQDDSGIGVKNGINMDGQKNLIGAFSPPYGVINDLDFLSTLPSDVALDGIAEAFKVAIIKDAAFFDYLEREAKALKNSVPEVMEKTVKVCAHIHLEHIKNSGDPFERGQVRPLDFGHWAAHRLESMSGYDLRHGQAVSVGIALDCFYAASIELISDQERDRIIDALKSSGLPTWHDLLAEPASDGTPSVLAGIEDFREHIGGKLSITLPKGIGSSVEVGVIDYKLMAECIDRLCVHENP